MYNVVFTLGKYSVTVLELLSVLTGLFSVWLAVKRHLFTWPLGILNEAGFFVLFYTAGLYADMLLQVFFFVTTVYGWYYWNKIKSGHVLRVTMLTWTQRWYYLGFVALGTCGIALMVMHLHTWMPVWFPHEASMPVPDSFIMVTSIVATWLMARAKLECWYAWIITDIAAIAVYAGKNLYLLSGEYVLFLILAASGLMVWKRNVV